MPQLLGHLNTVTDHQVVFAGAKQVFFVDPGRAHQGNAASQRLKNADRRDAGEPVRILAARDVHADHAFRINLGGKNIWEVAAVLDVGANQLLQCRIGIAHAMHHHTQLRQRDGRTDKKLIQFGGTLLIAPVADPDHINFFAALERMKLLYVSGLMKSPGTVNAKAIHVNASDRFAKGENAVYQVEMEFQDFTGASMGAMMAVMKQGDEAKFLLQGQHLVHHLWIIPLMQQDNVGFSEFVFKELLKIRVTGFVETDVQLGIGAPKSVNGFNGALAFLLHQVGERPRAQLFIAAHSVSHAHKLAHQPTQKMGVAVVPVRDHGMGKERDIELLLHALSAWAVTRLQ